ncbi:MAG TPA: hypothetical protein ENG87_04205, partial [Candidatus Pacearchaeota archaeon]|nr:hypothetical protein [Candidatus Pacearchaeota archaeon]
MIQYNHSKMNLPGGKAGWGGEGLWRLTLILGVLFFGLAYTVLVTGLGSVQSGETNLTVWDDSDSQIIYANYSVIYANYTNATSGNSINGSNVWCEFRHNKTGLWTSAVNMSFNPSTLQYEIIADGKYLTNHTTTMPIGIYALNVSCFNDLSYANVSTTDLINVSSYSTALAIENDTGKVVNEQTYFYANYTSSLMPVSGIGLNNYEIGQVVWNTSDLGNGIYSVALFDCENKGKKDCVVVGEYDDLWMYYSNGSLLHRATEPAENIYEIESGDLDNDGYENEVVVAGKDGYVRVFNETGDQVWASSDLGAVHSVAIADLDNDGIKDDFVVGYSVNATDKRIGVWNTSDGTTWHNLWNYTTGGTLSEVAIGDLDRDGNEDDVVTINDVEGQVWAFVGHNGTLIFNTTDLGIINSLAILDLDNDGFKDEIIVGENGDIYVFEWNGTWGSEYGGGDAIWQNTLPSRNIYELATTDLDDDGLEDDILAGDRGNYVWAFDNNSNQLWNFTFSGDGLSSIYSMAIGDIDDDGNKEVVFSEIDTDIVYVLNKSGSLLWSYKIRKGDIGFFYGSSTAIDISDINNDGINDIAVASVNGYAHILQSVTCSANFNDSTSFNMTWNNTIKKWQVNKSFSTTGDYDWNVTCEKGGYTEQTSSETVTISADTTSPTVNLISPANASTDTDGNVTFVYNATDNVGIANCSIYTDINGTWLLNQTLDSVSSGSNSFNISGIADGTYNWNVLCYDVNSLSDWNGANWTFTINTADITLPTITLNTPINNFNSTSINISFNFTATDSSGLKNATLYSNFSGIWLANETNQTALISGQFVLINVSNIPEGSFIWNVYVCDNAATPNCGFASANYSLTVDRTVPTLSLVAPSNNTGETSSNTITFTYNVSDTNAVDNCSLILNGAINLTNTSITKDTNQTFTQTLANANYNWSINCTDFINNIGASLIYNLSVNIASDVQAPMIYLENPPNNTINTT